MVTDHRHHCYRSLSDKIDSPRCTVAAGFAVIAVASAVVVPIVALALVEKMIAGAFLNLALQKKKEKKRRERGE